MYLQIEDNEKKKKQALIAGLVASLLCLILSGIFVWLGYQAFINKQNAKVDEQRVLSEISLRIGVEPNWPDVREYLFCRGLNKGMTREDVLNILNLIGPYYSTSDTFQIDFKDSYTRSALSPLMLHFSSGGYLESWEAGEFNFGPQAKCEWE